LIAHFSGAIKENARALCLGSTSPKKDVSLHDATVFLASSMRKSANYWETF
jgi:hypothetical protein